jgi:outer membrane immunogenic protein
LTTARAPNIRRARSTLRPHSALTRRSGNLPEFKTEAEMKRLLLSMTAIAALAIASQAAIAADMPARQPLPPQMPVKAVAPIFNWSGFYVGVHGGYGWGKSSFSDPAFTSGGYNADGWLFGGLAGVNYQVGQSVFGVEADLNWTDFSGSAACGAGGICSTSSDWLGTVRGRLGYAADRFMPYVTGGVAFGDVNASTSFGSASDTRVGWTAGVGAEYALTENMSWKTEYLYVDLGKFDCGAVCGGTTPTDVKFNSHIVRTGLNVRF